jgi:hypothetical protein
VNVRRDDTFYEDDEPIDDLIRAYKDGIPVVTAPAETPSQQCIRAATELTSLAENATRGPWELGDDMGILALQGHVDDKGEHAAIAIDVMQADGEWIVTFDPTTISIWTRWLHESAEKLAWAKTWDQVAETAVRHLVFLVLGGTDPGPARRYLSEQT